MPHADVPPVPTDGPLHSRRAWIAAGLSAATLHALGPLGNGRALLQATPDTWINVKTLGAVGDGAADDTAAIANAMQRAGTTGATLYFPTGTYRVSRTINPPAQLHLVFDRVTIQASPQGRFDAVTRPPRGRDNLSVLWNVDGSRWSTYSGILTLDGNHVAGLVGLCSASLEGGGLTTFAWLAVTNCAIGILAQGNGRGFAGCVFGLVRASCAQDLLLDGNAGDDMVFQSFRSHGQAGTGGRELAQIQIGTFGVVFNSLYIRGQRADRDGLVISPRGAAVLQHLYVEGTYRTPVRVGAGGQVTVADLKVSRHTASGDGSLIACEAESALIDVTVNGRAREATDIHTLIAIGCRAGTTHQRLIRARRAYLDGAQALLAFSGTGTSGADDIVIEEPGRSERLAYDGQATVRFPSHATPLMQIPAPADGVLDLTRGGDGSPRWPAQIVVVTPGPGTSLVLAAPGPEALGRDVVLGVRGGDVVLRDDGLRQSSFRGASGDRHLSSRSLLTLRCVDLAGTRCWQETWFAS